MNHEWFISFLWIFCQMYSEGDWIQHLSLVIWCSYEPPMFYDRSSLRKHVPQPIHPKPPLLVSSYVHPRIISLLICAWTIWQVEWQIRTGLSGTPPPGHREFLSPSTFSSPSNQPECISSTCQQRHFHMKARREGSSDLEEKWKFKGTFFVKVKVKGTPQWSQI